MLKICLLTSAHSPLDERIFHKEARTLQRAGYEVVIVAPYDHGEEIQGIRIRAVPPVVSRFDRLRRWQALYQAVLAEKPAVVHFHDPDLLPLALLLQRRRRLPVIYDVHEYYGDSLLTRYWLPKLWRKPISRGVERFEKWASKFFAGIITVNQHMARLFRQVNAEVVVLHNYPLREQFPLERPAGPKPPVVLYLGGMNRERGLEVILQAMRLVKEAHPEVECVLVGTVDTAELAAEFSDIQAWLAAGNIRMRGQIPYEEVPGVLQESAIALVPLLPTLNYQKAIPVKLLEYMAAGLPVVGSDFGYIREIIQKNECGRLVAPEDPAALADGILWLLNHPAEALRYGQRGWDAFQSEYTWEKEQEQLTALYGRILAKGEQG
ncbi:MAG: glycosyltransferase family 4 protein [Peptococcaceae bacterium]|jgi:glycosyltransferase involved in cell wall biosynthesis|nr:glycosyltransferase family 4 protein [Peptococcaceae bacterium]